MLVYTIGHSTRTTEAFVELLDEFGVKHLVDVRRYPGSRRNPHFSRDVLQKNLEERGIDYTHLEALGGRRRPNPDSPNTHWTSDGFRGYADYTATASFDAGLTELVRIANRQTTAVMCAEAVYWKCHRQLLADSLVAREVAVRHIMRLGTAEPHELNPAALILPDGRLQYPSREPDQIGLFAEHATEKDVRPE